MFLWAVHTLFRDSVGIVDIYVLILSTATLLHQVNMSLLSCFVDNCKKLGLVFENAVGIVEIINSKDIKLQVRLWTL